MSAHSTFIGGSSAERFLNCAGSHQLIQRLPAADDSPSTFAIYGTAMHAVSEQLLRSVGTKVGMPDFDQMCDMARGMIGVTFNHHDGEHTFTQEDYDECIEPMLDSLYAIMDNYGDGFHVAAVEMRVTFPGLPGSFGTADLLLTSSTHALLVDFKFGAGVPVKVVYDDIRGGQVLNAQLAFYLTSAMSTFPKHFRKKKLVIAVIQPRMTGERFSFTDVDYEEIPQFVEDMKRAAVAAIGRDPPLNRGHWCRWCTAKPACPKWVGPIIELAAIAGKPLSSTVPANTKVASEYEQYLGRAMDLAELAESYIDTLRDAVHAYLTAGGKVPGWTLEPKKKLRQWIDEDVVEKELLRLEFEEHEIWQHKLRTFGDTDKTAKRLGKKIPDVLRVAPVTNETNVVRASGASAMIEPITALKQLQDSVKALNSRKG